MGALEIINLIEIAAKAGMDLYAKWKAGEIVLSDTEVASVHAALLNAEAATAALRPLVDADLAEAAKK